MGISQPIFCHHIANLWHQYTLVSVTKAHCACITSLWTGSQVERSQKKKKSMAWGSLKTVLMPPIHDTRFWCHDLIGQITDCWQVSDEYFTLLYKHQWNTRWAFARKLDIFTCENNMLSSHVKKSPLLWLHNISHLSHKKTIKVKWFGILLVFI